MFKYLFIAILTFFFTVVAEWPFALALVFSTAFTVAWNWHENKLDKEYQGQELPEELPEELPVYPK